MNNRCRLAALLAVGVMSTAISVGQRGTAHAAPITPVSTPAAAAAISQTKAVMTQSAPEFVRLRIRPRPNGDNSITLSGRVNLTVEPAEYYAQLYGEDTFFDDTPVCSTGGQTTTGGPRAIISYNWTCPDDLLDEDLGDDEIYARVFLFEPGRPSRQLRSNTVTGSF
jgi:hypothetical protein